MIDSMADLELDKIDTKLENGLQLVENVLKEKLGVGYKDLTNPLIQYVQSHAEELALKFPNIAPRGDYSKIIEDNDGMANFLKSLDKTEDWRISAIEEDKKFELLKFSFICTAVDDGDSLEGFTYLTKSGKLKHSFAQYAG